MSLVDLRIMAAGLLAVGLIWRFNAGVAPHAAEVGSRFRDCPGQCSP